MTPGNSLRNSTPRCRSGRWAESAGRRLLGAAWIALVFIGNTAIGQLLDGPSDPPWPGETRPAQRGVAAWTGPWREYTFGFDEDANRPTGFTRPAAGIASSRLPDPTAIQRAWPATPAAGRLNGPQAADGRWPLDAYQSTLAQNGKKFNALLGSGSSGLGTGPDVGELAGSCLSCDQQSPMMYSDSTHFGAFVHSRLFGFLHHSEGRHQGIGRPLERESWRYRPFSAGWMMGAMVGSSLIDDWVGQNTGYFGGYRLGWDFDDYWGFEMRFAFASVGLFDSNRAKQAQQAADALLGLSADDPFLSRFDHRRDANLTLWDVSFLHYPWGDAAWRPYWSIGLGTVHVRFMDRLSRRYSTTKFGLPIAIGMKYRYDDRLALRLEVADQIAIGGPTETLHNLSLTGGLEVRFGGSRTVYWPYSPGRYYW